MFLVWGCVMFPGQTWMHNTLIRHWCTCQLPDVQTHTCRTKGLYRQSLRLLHTSTDHLSSLSAPSLPPLCLRLLPSVLSPYPLINQVVHFHLQEKNELWSSFLTSLSLETKHALFFFFFFFYPKKPNTPAADTLLCVSVSTWTHRAPHR